MVLPLEISQSVSTVCVGRVDEFSHAVSFFGATIHPAGAGSNHSAVAKGADSFGDS
jgi:hypothetical protein